MSQLVPSSLEQNESFEVRETSAAAFVDGNAGLGAVVGQFSMELAIEKVWTT